MDFCRDEVNGLRDDRWASSSRSSKTTLCKVSKDLTEGHLLDHQMGKKLTTSQSEYLHLL